MCIPARDPLKDSRQLNPATTTSNNTSLNKKLKSPPFQSCLPSVESLVKSCSRSPLTSRRLPRRAPSVHTATMFRQLSSSKIAIINSISNRPYRKSISQERCTMRLRTRIISRSNPSLSQPQTWNSSMRRRKPKWSRMYSIRSRPRLESVAREARAPTSIIAATTTTRASSSARSKRHRSREASVVANKRSLRSTARARKMKRLSRSEEILSLV